MIDGINLAFQILQSAFNWIFSNEYTALVVGISLIMFVFGLVFTKVRG